MIEANKENWSPFFLVKMYVQMRDFFSLVYQIFEVSLLTFLTSQVEFFTGVGEESQFCFYWFNYDTKSSVHGL